MPGEPLVSLPPALPCVILPEGVTLAAPGDNMPLLILAIIGYVPWPLFIGYALWKLRRRLAALLSGAAASADSTAAEEDDEEEEVKQADGEVEPSQLIMDFLDTKHTSAAFSPATGRSALAAAALVATAR